MKTPDYLSYDRYKKKKDSNPNRRILIFITTFFATLFVFTLIAKSLSPNVDVTIGDEAQTDPKETGLGVKKFIDERLRMIQMDDSSAGVSVKKEDKQTSEYNDDGFYKYQPQEEKINLPSKQKKPELQENTYDKDEEPIELASPVARKPAVVKAPPRPSAKDLSKPFESPKMSKVYVGRYSTLEQAKVAQEILLDSGLGITPFVKDAGSYYTLQIGSYSSRAKADGLASELQRNSFPARVVQE
jgi:hypothetical protein